MSHVDGNDDGVGYGVSGVSEKEEGHGVYGFSDRWIGVRGESNYHISVYGYSDSYVGVGGGSNLGAGVWGYSDSYVGVGGDSSYIGVYGLSNGGYGLVGFTYTGTGMYGRSSIGYGVEGHSDSSIGVVGSSDIGIGVDGYSYSYTGVRGRSDSGYGMYGYSDSGYGVIGLSPSGVGVFGSSSINYGVAGYSNLATGVFGSSDSFIGVEGESKYLFGVSGISESFIGVYGEAGLEGKEYPDLKEPIGVLGISVAQNGIGVQGTARRGGWAGKFYGNVNVTGSLQKAGGQFKIDHPLDPANKYLCHSFVESPDMKNVYDGVVALDDKGEAEIELPDWFGALNKDFRYQLTAIGAPGPNLYIAEEIFDMTTNDSSSNNNNSHFKIAGGAPGMKVSWHVTGIRKDPWANAHRIQVEEDKPDSERGYYLYPELYGQPEEKGISRLLFPEQKQELLINEQA